MSHRGSQARAALCRAGCSASGLLLLALLSGCGGGGGGGGGNGGGSAAPGQDFLGNTPGPQNASVIAPPAPAMPGNNAAITRCPTDSAGEPANANQPGIIVGQVGFDRVEFGALGSGLNFSNITSQWARGVVVEAVLPDCNGSTVVDTTLTDGSGWYALNTGNPATQVCVRARAQLYRAGSPSWNIAVADNTDNNRYYVMADSLVASAAAKPHRDLHAASGWGGAAYTGPRVAAPFAILDTACTAMDTMLDFNGAAQFGTLSLLWSVNNREENGAVSEGKIGSAYFNTDERAIYLRGDAASNTDEFDQTVIAHEFGHFLTHTFSRSDSIGGEHDLTQYLDPRLAFDEGWATAFAGLALHSPYYRDSMLSSEYAFDIRTPPAYAALGWAAEATNQSLLYNAGIDNGPNSLLTTFTSTAYRGNAALASLFSFGALYKPVYPSFATALNNAGIDAADAFASGESQAPDPVRDLPWYTPIGIGGSTRICSSADHGVGNKLSNRRYLRLDITQGGRYRILVQPAADSPAAVAGLELMQGSSYLEPGSTDIYLDFRTGSTASPSVATTWPLGAGVTYVLGVFHLGNQQVNSTTPAPGYFCFNVSVNAAP